MPATIKDIAKKLNVSVSTVSYALNGGPRGVPAEVKKRILEVARELDYRPNRLAKSLVKGRTHTIGVVPPDPTPNLIVIPYITEMLNGIVNEAERCELDVLLVTRQTRDHHRIANELLDGRMDGAILLAPRGEEMLKVLDERGLPFSVVAGPGSGPGIHIRPDNEHGVDQALQHLYDLGHRKIGHIQGQLDMDDGASRFEKYRAFLQSHDLPYRPEWVACGMFTFHDGARAAREILCQDNRPTAIFAANDESAISTLRVAHELGLDVPGELSLVGYDDAPLAVRMTPSLTTVRQPTSQLGELAMRLLSEKIEGRAAESTTLCTELVVRDSTGRPKEDH